MNKPIITGGNVIHGTLVLVAPQDAASVDLEDSAIEASKHHKGAVIVLPYGWRAMEAEEVVQALNAANQGKRVQAKYEIVPTENIGPTKPPPPPPPPS